MNKIIFMFLLISQILSAQYHQYVSPFIGTGGYEHTYPGATMPFGMAQLSPDTRIDNSWDGCSGYHYKGPHDYSIQIRSKVHPLYTADFAEALLDGIEGTINWRKGDWQGYFGTDFEAIIDLKIETGISSVSANFLHDAKP